MNEYLKIEMMVNDLCECIEHLKDVGVNDSNFGQACVLLDFINSLQIIHPQMKEHFMIDLGILIHSYLIVQGIDPLEG